MLRAVAAPRDVFIEFQRQRARVVGPEALHAERAVAVIDLGLGVVVAVAELIEYPNDYRLQLYSLQYTYTTPWTQP